jgi:hypothetical protein
MKKLIITTLLLVSAVSQSKATGIDVIDVLATDRSSPELTQKQDERNLHEIITINQTTSYFYRPSGNKALKSVFETLARNGYILDDGWSEPVSGIFTVHGTKQALSTSSFMAALNHHGKAVIEFTSSQQSYIGQPLPIVISNRLENLGDSTEFASNIYLKSMHEKDKLINYEINIQPSNFLISTSSVVKLSDNSVIVDIHPIGENYLIILTSVTLKKIN